MINLTVGLCCQFYVLNLAESHRQGPTGANSAGHTATTGATGAHQRPIQGKELSVLTLFFCSPNLPSLNLLYSSVLEKTVQLLRDENQPDRFQSNGDSMKTYFTTVAFSTGESSKVNLCNACKIRHGVFGI